MTAGVTAAETATTVTAATITDLTDESPVNIAHGTPEQNTDDSDTTATRACVCGAPLHARQWFCSPACKRRVTWNCVEAILLRAGK